MRLSSRYQILMSHTGGTRPRSLSLRPSAVQTGHNRSKRSDRDPGQLCELPYLDTPGFSPLFLTNIIHSDASSESGEISHRTAMPRPAEDVYSHHMRIGQQPQQPHLRDTAERQMVSATLFRPLHSHAIVDVPH